MKVGLFAEYCSKLRTKTPLTPHSVGSIVILRLNKNMSKPKEMNQQEFELLLLSLPTLDEN